MVNFESRAKSVVFQIVCKIRELQKDQELAKDFRTETRTRSQSDMVFCKYESKRLISYDCRKEAPSLSLHTIRCSRAHRWVAPSVIGFHIQLSVDGSLYCIINWFTENISHLTKCSGLLVHVKNNK